MSTKRTNWATQTNKNLLNLAIWTITWVGTLALASFGPKFLWPDTSALTLVAILVNAGFGIGMIVANRRYLNGLDELQKKIHLESMAVALGIGIVGGLSYSLLDATDIISGNADISVIYVLISIAYLGGIIIGQKRYS